MNFATQQHLALVASFGTVTPSADTVRDGYRLASVLNIRTGEEFNPHGIAAVSEWELAAYQLGYESDPDEVEVPLVFQGTALALYWIDGRAHADEDAFCGESAASGWEESVDGSSHHTCH